MALRSDAWKRVHQNRPGIEQFPRQLRHLSSWDVCKDCCKVISLTRHRINRWRTITHICSSRPHISAVFLWEGRFTTGLADCPHISGEKGHGKYIFSRTLNRVEIFENIGFSFNCGRPKRENFEHHILLPLCMLLKNAIVISLFLAIFFGARTRIFWQRRKNLPF